MNPTMQIMQEAQLPNYHVVRQVMEVYENGIVGYRIIETDGFKVVSVGALFDELRSNRLYAKRTNIRGTVQRI